MFTMEEYIERNKLGVSHKNPQATRLIAEHLRKKGYVVKTLQIKGERRRRWVHKDDTSFVNYSELKGRLAALEEGDEESH